VLSHYVQDGVEELNRSKLAMLLNLQYGAISGGFRIWEQLKKSARCLWDFRMLSGDFHRFTATRVIRSPNFGLKTTK
jgi:hypothetical protein